MISLVTPTQTHSQPITSGPKSLLSRPVAAIRSLLNLNPSHSDQSIHNSSADYESSLSLELDPPSPPYEQSSEYDDENPSPIFPSPQPQTSDPQKKSNNTTVSDPAPKSQTPSPHDPSLSAIQLAMHSVVVANSWTVLGILSCRSNSIAFVIQSNNKRRVIRLSKETDHHSTFDFAEYWSGRECPYLPQMEEPRIICLSPSENPDDDDDDEPGIFYVLEEYEFVEAIPGGGHCDFYSYLRYGGYADVMKWKYMFDVTCGIEFLVDNHWCHGDISIENIVRGVDRTKLIDFESSIHFDPYVAYPASCIRMTKTLYRPPELDFGNYLFFPAFVDIWSIGVILFMLATGRFPFAMDQEIRDEQFEFICEYGFRRFANEKCTDVGKLGESLLDLLNGIFVVFEKEDAGDGFFLCQPKGDRQRMTPSEVTQHAFFG